MSRLLTPSTGSFVSSSLESGRPKRVLIVDDQDESPRLIDRILGAVGYETERARDGVEALAKVQLDIDLVLLDAEMPGMDGFTVAKKIRESPAWADLPIIMVTGLTSKADRLRAVEAGVNDFITKPFEKVELTVRCARLLELKEIHDALKRQRTELEKSVEKRTSALRRALDDMVAAQRRTYDAQLDTIRRLVIASEYKDRDTAAHIERIGKLSEALARNLGMSPGEVETIRHAAPMHDVGKIGIPDAILLKPGKLDAGEWEIMRMHTIIGGRILHGSPSELLQQGESIALSHHEHWDGRGYPNGLAGEAIPLAGRICAVADVFDALTSDRSYRPAMPNETVFGMLRESSGSHLDPKVVDVFFAHLDQMLEIQREGRLLAPTAAGSP